MNAATIEQWIRNLGRTYAELVAERIIPDQPLTELYKGRDWLSLHPQTGIELSFWAETKRFETLYIGILETLPGAPTYRGKLPKPFIPSMTQAGVRTTFGEPMKSKGPMKMPKPIGMVGGCDAYRLDPSIHSNALVKFQYTAELAVKTLVFSLIDKGHD